MADSALQSVTFSDLGITDGTVGQVLTTDGSGTYTFEDAAIGGAIVSGTAPVSPEQGALWFDNTNTGQLYTYAGSSWLSTAGISTLEFSSVGDLGDVDLVSNVPTAGQALVWDNVNSKFIPGDVGADFTGYATETFVTSAISTASSDYATAAQGALADSALQSVAFADLTTTPTTLAGYGITDAFDGAYGSLSGTPTLGTASAQDVGYFATSAQGALADSALQSADLTGYATEAYVGQQFDLLIDAAPGTLDTLNELAAALGDDANFSTSVTNSIALKANSADLGTAAAQDVGYFATAAQGTLADSALQSVTFADLTTTPTTLVGYGITDAPSTLTDLGITDGTVGQILTTDGAGGFTFEDAAEPLVVSGTAPASPTEGALWFDNVTTGQLYAYVGTSWLSTAGITTLEFSSVGDLSDVDITSAAPSNGQALIWDNANSKFVPGNVAVDLTGYATETFVGTAITNASSNYATAAQGTLADSALQSVAFADLTTTPTTLVGYGITDAFDGAYGSLSGTPTIPSVITDLGIVDGTAGQVLTTNGSGVYTFSDTAVAYGDSDVATYLSSNDYATATSIIATITDSAPGTLDTLNELAAALGDDANFSTTVTNSIALKANSADLGTAAAQDVGYFATAAQGALADSALQSVAFADLGITDGTVGQVLTTDGAGVYTFEDAANPTTVSGTAPASPNEGDLWFDNVTTGQLYTYVGSSWLSTAGITTLEFSSVGDLSDVDITTSAPTAGQALIWDAVNSKFIPGESFSQSDFDTAFTANSTDDLSEGATNLYYTDTRADARIALASSNYATAAQGALADSALQSVAFADLTTTPTTLAGYGITDAATSAQGALADSALQTADLNGYATETYVGTAISNLIDTAPTTLDTLNELAAALGDDPNFATSVTNSIGLKANTADLGTAAYEDVGYFATAAQGTLADTALQSVAFADLTTTPTTLVGYGITDAFDGAYSSLTGAPTLGTASAEDTTAFATAAQGVLADSALQSVAFADLTTTPTTLAGYGITDTIPSSLTDLGITDGTVGQLLSTDGSGNFTFVDAAAGSSVTVSATAPLTPNEGDLWFDDTTTGQLYVYENSAWTSTGIPPSIGSIDELADVDTTTIAPVAGQSLVWDAVNSKFIPGDVVADFSGYATETFVGTAISTASSDYATAAQGALADTALQSVAFTELTSTPTTLAGYGITDAFDGAYGSLSGAPTLGTASAQDVGYFATAAQGALADSSIQSLAGYATETYVNTAVSNLVDAAPGTLDTLNELAAALGDDANFATTTANAIALKANSADLGTASAQDVGYFATAAQGALADTALQSVAFTDLTSTPTTLAGYGITDAFDGAYGSLSGTPTIPSLLTDLGITDGTVGQVLVTDGAGVYTFEDASASGATVSGTAPVAPEQGALWFDNTNTGQLYTYVGASWLSTAGISTLEFSSVGDLGDVDLVTNAPTDGQSLVWDNANSKFVPGTVSSDLTGYATETFVGTAISTASSNYATAAQGALADTALQSVAFTDLTSTPTTLAGYGITDAATTAQGALADTALQSADLTGYATETYVNTAVSNLVDAAPGTLDTLNELAAALGDDANFATTTANAIGLKANSADLGTAAAQDVGYFATAAQGALADSALQSADLTGYATETFVGTAISTASADYATAAQGALADSALQSVAFADLTSTPTTLAGYGITDSFFDGAYSSLTGAPTIPSALTDLGITDGTVGQVLTTNGSGTYTFEDASASGATVSGTAPVIANEGDLWFDSVNTGELHVYESGIWLSTAVPAIIESINELGDVDITTTAPTDGQSLIWDNANSKFVPGDVAGGGGSSITTSETAPVSPTAGDMWFNSATLALYLYYADGDSTQWIQINDAGGAAGNGLVLISSTPPANPASGDLWYDDGSTGSLLIYNGSVWVSTADGGGGGGQSTYWVETSATYDATAGSKLFVDTSSSAVQVNLPASPVMGDEVYVVDAAGNSGTYNITVNRNGKKITGLDENFTIDVNGAAIILAYYNATRGWIVISK